MDFEAGAVQVFKRRPIVAAAGTDCNGCERATSRPWRGIDPEAARRSLLEKAGLPRIRFHDLRHACATFLLAKGVDIAVVRDILGQSQIATTADIYAHVLSSFRDEAADAMDDLFES